MRILGLNHDLYISSAAIIENGKILAAAAEERFTKQKMTRAFPMNAIKYCLEEAGLCIEEIDYIATSWNPGVYFHKFNPLISDSRRHKSEYLYSIPDNIMRLHRDPDVEYIMQEHIQGNGSCKICYVTHHRAHSANAYLLSPFDGAAILTADAQGEFESTTFGVGRGNKIEVYDSINYPQSLGAMYSTFTEYLGFKPNSDEWKVMALASYTNWNNRYYKKMIDDVFRLIDDGKYEFNLSYFNGYNAEQPHLYTSKLVSDFGLARQEDEDIEERHYSIAAALQKASEDIMLHMLYALHRRTKLKNLTVSGGCFMNSVFNGKILSNTPFEKLFVSSCPDDSGNSFGAAFYLHNHILGNSTREYLVHNYYGPQYDNESIAKALEKVGIKSRFVDDVARETAKLLSEGKLIGWFQGRMEFGQRALGNRSILADPRRADTKDKVNFAIKYREAFRPFAPAVLEECASEYFDLDPGVDVPFMEKVYPIKASQQSKIPAVVHVDGSGRLQTVNKILNNRYYEMIEEFGKLTDIPIVLNTSFNLNGEPIVCSPEDAIRTFYSCGLDVLVLGNYVIEKC